MKILYFVLLLLLFGCSNLSNDEKNLVGYWQWSIQREGFIEKGFVELKKDKTFTYRIESKIPVEGLIEEKDGTFGNWVYEDKSICFHPKGNIKEKRCVFNEVQFEENSISFKIIGFFNGTRIHAIKI